MRPLLVDLVRASPTFKMENQVLATYLCHFRRTTAVSRFVLFFKLFVFVSFWDLQCEYHTAVTK